MRTTGSNFFVAAVLGLFGLAYAHDGHDHGGAEHGGVEAKTKRHHFEAVFSKGGVKLYAHGADHKPLDTSRLTATATFYHPSSPKPWFGRELRPGVASPGQPSPSLDLALNLGTVPATGAKVTFQVAGLPDSAEPTATFTVPVRFDSGAITVAMATAADQKAMAAQRVCAVSGEELGSMGPPLKVARGERATFICCKGCLKEIQANPDRFLRAAPGATKAHTGHDHHDNAH